MFKKVLCKKTVSVLAALSMMGSLISVGAADFSDETLPENVLATEIKTAAINNDADGYHFENGVAGRAADDKSLVFDLSLENGEADAAMADGIHYSNGAVNGSRTIEFSVMFNGDYDGGELYQSITRNGGRVTNRLIDFRSDGKILAAENNGMTEAGTYKKGEWVNIAVTWNVDGSYKLWINDTLARTASIDGEGDVTVWNWIRIGTYTAENTSDSVKNIKFAIDDFNAYDGEYEVIEQARRIAYAPAKGYALIAARQTAVISENATLAEVTAGINASNAVVRVYTDDTFETQVTNTASIVSDGAKIVAQAVNNSIIDTWTVSTASKLIDGSAFDFSDGTLPDNVLISEIKTAEINNDAKGYHFEKGVAGRAANDQSVVVDLSLEKGEADNSQVDVINYSNITVDGSRTIEFSVMFNGDYDGGEVYQSITREGGRVTNRFLQFTNDGKIMAPEGNRMTVAGAYNKGEWVRIAITWNVDGSYKLWINDLLAKAGATIDGTGNVTAWNWIRIGTYTAENTSATVKNIKFAVDDFNAYDGDHTATAYEDRISYAQTDDYALINASRTAVIPANATLKDVESGLNATNALVRVYTDDTFASRITNPNAAVPNGAKIVAESKKNYRIDTWTVSTDSESKEIASFDFEDEASPVSFVDNNEIYESAAIADGGYGKASHAYKVTAANVPSDVRTFGRISMLDSLSETIGSGNNIAAGVRAVEKNLMTLEFSMLADGDFSQINMVARDAFFDSQDNAVVPGVTSCFQIRPYGAITYTDTEENTYTSEVGFEKGKWNRVAMTFDPKTFGVTVYVNGQEAVPYRQLGASTDKNRYVYMGLNWLSPVMNILADENAQGARNAILSIDDIDAYYGAYSPDDADEAQIISTNLEMYNRTLYLGEDNSVFSFISDSDFGNASAAIYADDTYTEYLDPSDELSEGNIVVITSENGKTYKYYTVAAPASVPELKTYVDGVEGDLISGSSTISARYTSEESGRTVILAIYDASGKLERLVCDDTAPYEVSYTVENSEGIKAKAMVWDSLEGARPIVPAKEFINLENIE